MKIVYKQLLSGCFILLLLHNQSIAMHSRFIDESVESTRSLVSINNHQRLEVAHIKDLGKHVSEQVISKPSGDGEHLDKQPLALTTTDVNLHDPVVPIVESKAQLVRSQGKPVNTRAVQLIMNSGKNRQEQIKALLDLLMITDDMSVVMDISDFNDYDARILPYLAEDKAVVLSIIQDSEKTLEQKLVSLNKAFKSPMRKGLTTNGLGDQLFLEAINDLTDRIAKVKERSENPKIKIAHLKSDILLLKDQSDAVKTMNAWIVKTLQILLKRVALNKESAKLMVMRLFGLSKTTVPLSEQQIIADNVADSLPSFSQSSLAAMNLWIDETAQKISHAIFSTSRSN